MRLGRIISQYHKGRSLTLLRFLSVLTAYSITVFEKQSLGVIDQSLWHTFLLPRYLKSLIYNSVAELRLYFKSRLHIIGLSK